MRAATLIIPFLLGLTSAVEVTRFDQLAAAKKNPQKRITIKNLHVPAKATLDLKNLQPGTLVEFAGRITFGYAEWKGNLIEITGKNIRVEGRPGHVIDIEGHRWWDGKGGHGKPKPTRAMEVHLDDSTINGLNFKNPAVACFVANWCHNLVISNINIDGAAGDKPPYAYNTDGIGVGFGQNVKILNSRVHNQDDCFVTGAGKDILIDNLECVGGHGISIGTLGNGATVENVLIRNSRIINNMVGIRIKTGVNAKGLIRNITYDNIELKGINDYGIIIHGNYGSIGGPQGQPTPFPIEDITLRNIRGPLNKKAVNIWIYVAAGAKNWRFENIKIHGGMSEKACKGIPPGLRVACGVKG